ncbi:hypothetical protein ACWFQ8_09840 [Streptomyces sp. NPDC055254]
MSSAGLAANTESPRYGLLVSGASDRAADHPDVKVLELDTALRDLNEE